MSRFAIGLSGECSVYRPRIVPVPRRAENLRDALMASDLRKTCAFGRVCVRVPAPLVSSSTTLGRPFSIDERVAT